MRRIKVRLLGCFFLAFLALPGLAGAFDLGNLGTQFNVPPVQFNVTAEGTGEAGVADGTLYNATALNPALLANAPHFGEITFGLSISNDIFTIANYLTNSNNINNFQSAFQNLAPSMQEITQGLNQSTPNVTQINQGLAGVQNALTNLQTAAATLTDRNIQLGAGFNIAMKFNDHWGFQVYNNTHGVLQVAPEGALTALEYMKALPTLTGSSPASIYSAASTFLGGAVTVLQALFPSQAASLQAAVTTLEANQTSAGVSQFASTVSNIVSSVNQTAFQQSLLQNIAEISGLVYTDTVAMATYSFNPLEPETPLTIGANFKIVNRRIGYVNSTWLSTQNLNDFSSITNEMKNDIDQSTFRWGLDLGLLYEFEEARLSVGASAQDLLHSSATIHTLPGDPLYGIITDPAPTVITLGASWNPINPLILNADIDDLFSATSYYEGLDIASHAKLGAAFNVLGFLQLRGGVSNSNFGCGFGVPFLGLDYAYAVDDLTQSYNHYLNFQVVF
jgi:hypothetical protein